MLRLSSRSLWLVLLMALALSACQQEQETTAVANEAAEAVADVADADKDAAGPAPLLDREIFFGNPEIAFAALSPTGQYVAFARELDGILKHIK